MDVYKDITSDLCDSASGVDDAVGVPEAKWFIAIVNNRAEKSVAEKLSKLGEAVRKPYSPTSQQHP